MFILKRELVYIWENKDSWDEERKNYREEVFNLRKEKLCVDEEFCVIKDDYENIKERFFVMKIEKGYCDEENGRFKEEI